MRKACAWCGNNFEVPFKKKPRATCSKECRIELANSNGAGQTKEKAELCHDEIWRRAAIVRQNTMNAMAGKPGIKYDW